MEVPPSIWEIEAAGLGLQVQGGAGGGVSGGSPQSQSVWLAVLALNLWISGVSQGTGVAVKCLCE